MASIQIQIRIQSEDFAAYAYAPAGQGCPAWRDYIDAQLEAGKIPEILYDEMVSNIDAIVGTWIDVTAKVSFTPPSYIEVQEWALLRCSTESTAEDGSIEYSYPFEFRSNALETLYNAEYANFIYVTTATIN